MIHKTYIINLAKRKDRKKHILNVFQERKEFDFEIFKAIENPIGTMGLFLSFREIINKAVFQELPYVIICEDDHVFTSTYNTTFLNRLIQIGLENKFDILLGGASNIHDILFMEDDLVWLSGFTGLQFTVVFNRFYDTITSLKFPEKGMGLDLFLSNLSDNIFTCYPFISKQVSFGYSDATLNNNNIDVSLYFDKCQSKLNSLYKVNQHYKKTTNRL